MTTNQCDGCARGLPLYGKWHYDSASHFPTIWTPCTAHLTDQRFEAVGGREQLLTEERLYSLGVDESGDILVGSPDGIIVAKTSNAHLQLRHIQKFVDLANAALRHEREEATAPSQSSDHLTPKNESFRAVRYLLVQYPEKHIDKLLDAHQDLETRLRAAERELVECKRDAEILEKYVGKDCIADGAAWNERARAMQRIRERAALNAQKGRQDGPTGEQHG